MTERMAYRIMSVLAALIGCVLLVVLVVPSAGAMLGQVGAHFGVSRWERTEGRVIAHARQPSGAFGVGFSVGARDRSELTIEYRAEGETHSVRAWLDPTPGASDARLASLRESGVIVRYPPGRPAEGVAEGDGIEEAGSIAGLAVGILFAAIAGYGARRLWRESGQARATR